MERIKKVFSLQKDTCYILLNIINKIYVASSLKKQYIYIESECNPFPCLKLLGKNACGLLFGFQYF